MKTINYFKIVLNAGPPGRATAGLPGSPGPKGDRGTRGARGYKGAKGSVGTSGKCTNKQCSGKSGKLKSSGHL